MKAFALGTMLLCGALAACSSSGDDGTGTGTGSGSGGGDGDGGSDAGTGGSTSTTPSSTGTTPTTTTGTTTATTASGTQCLGGEAFFEDAVCDGCLKASCCDQAEACIADFQAGGEDCVLQDGTGAFNQDGALYGALAACLDANCTDECGGAGVCDSGLSTQDPDVDACIDANCCTEFTDCFGASGENLDACNACLEAGGGPECDGYLACTDEAGCFGYQVCDSNLSVTTDELATCLGDNCCDVVTTCFGETEQDFNDCVDCLEGGGGPLCDGVIACDTEFECGLLTEG
jgi:hypothetical protein